MIPTGPKPKTTRRFNWRRLGLVLLVIAVGVVFYLGSSIWILLTGIQEEPGEEPAGELVAQVPEPKPNERINILFLGVDAPQVWNGKPVPRRSDTMMLVSIDPLTHKVGLLSIPRDTRVHIDALPPYKPNESVEKINAAHAHGGPKFAMQTVSQFLGVPVHYYVRLDFQGFVQIVDTLGGVDINVEKDMDYEDPTQPLTTIHIKKGPQHLDGITALGYVRFRDDGDIDRIARQQHFLEVMLDKMLNAGTILKLPKLASDVAKYVDTDIPTDKILYLARLGTGIKADDLQTGTVPGEPKWIEESIGRISYWVADEKGLEEVTDRLIRGIDKEYNATVSVRVLNATSIEGAANKLAGILAGQGFDVVEVGNTEERDNPATTRIVNAYDTPLPGQITARSVLRIIPSAELFDVTGDVEETPEPAVTITIGLDFPEDIQTGSIDP